jgi:hypothetical protein
MMFLYTYSALLSAIVLLYCAYLYVKPKSMPNKGQSFSYIFIFCVLWIFFLVVQFTEAKFDFGFKKQIFITSVPIFFTFLIITFVIYNLQEILNYFSPNPAFLRKFKWVAALCVLTQVANPVMASFENGDSA